MNVAVKARSDTLFTATTLADTATERAHGTMTKYVNDKCRCKECKEAARLYASGLRRRKAYAAHNPERWDWVDAEGAREHVMFLRSAGIGPKKIAEVSGVPHGSLAKLVYGDKKRGTPPSKRIHRDTERRILSVSVDDRSEGHRVLADETWRQIEEMRSFGIPKLRVARAIGQRVGGLQIGKCLVHKRTADAVARVHWSVFARFPEFRQVCRCGMPEEIARTLGFKEI